MISVEPGALQRLLAEAFDRQGWAYDLGVGRSLVEALEGGRFSSEEFASGLSRAFYERNRTTPVHVAAVIEKVVRGTKLERSTEAVTLVIADNRHQVNLGAGASVTNSNLNVGTGSQLNVHVSSDKSELLAAVEALVRGGLAGGWNADAAADLAAMIDERDDITVDDVQSTATRTGTQVGASAGAMKGLLREIAAGGLGGTLASGITAALGELSSQLPL